MAYFKGTMQGDKSQTESCVGHKTTGLRSTITGWYHGISVHAIKNHKTGFAEFYIYKTIGAQPTTNNQLLLSIINGKVEVK